MSLDHKEIKRVAELAKLSISDADLVAVANKLNSVLTLGERLREIDTRHIEPLSHPLGLNQPLRPDAVTETNQRELFQKIAPMTKAGLYLVPQVIETEP